MQCSGMRSAETSRVRGLPVNRLRRGIQMNWPLLATLHDGHLQKFKCRFSVVNIGVSLSPIQQLLRTSSYQILDTFLGVIARSCSQKPGHSEEPNEVGICCSRGLSLLCKERHLLTIARMSRLVASSRPLYSNRHVVRDERPNT